MIGSDLEVVFFDVDDTLFDKQEAHERALKEIWEERPFFHGIDIDELLNAFHQADREAIDGFRDGVPMKELRWNRSMRVLEKLGVDTEHTDRFHADFSRIYPSIPVEIEGAKEVIPTLSQRYELGILTNSTRDVQMRKLSVLEIKDHFEEFVFSEEVGSRKPDKGVFEHALKLVDREPEQVLYVGDSYRADVKGAKKVNMRTCWLNRHKKKEDGPEPDLNIAGLPELLEYLG